MNDSYTSFKNATIKHISSCLPVCQQAPFRRHTLSPEVSHTLAGFLSATAAANNPSRFCRCLQEGNRQRQASAADYKYRPRWRNPISCLRGEVRWSIVFIEGRRMKKNKTGKALEYRSDPNGGVVFPLLNVMESCDYGATEVKPSAWTLPAVGQSHEIWFWGCLALV